MKPKNFKPGDVVYIVDLSTQLKILPNKPIPKR